MTTITGDNSTGNGTTRRDFLQAGVLGAVGLGLSQFPEMKAMGQVAGGHDERSVIMIFNLGGPSHLDLFDPKPDAPSEIRGPFNAIRTKGDFQLTELLPLHAKIADKFSVVRSCHHTAAPVHDTGHQMLQTGRLFADGVHAPHVGCALQFLKGSRKGLPAHVVLPAPMGKTGGNMPHGQGAGFLGSEYDPFYADVSDEGDVVTTPERADVGLITSTRARGAFDLTREARAARERYGATRFGRSCLLARRLVEAGTRFVTINTFTTVFDEITWDVHGHRPFTTLREMAERVCPMYDLAYSALIEDLDRRGLLPNTLVCNLAEFGRTPRINPGGGRDHWPACWTSYFAGGGVRGGRAVGRSDEIGAHPADRPVAPAEIVATIYKSLGVDLRTTLPGSAGEPIPLLDAGISAIEELF